MVARFQKQMADYARGKRLRSLREARRLSQEDAAHEIGVSAKTLRTWEKGGPIKWANAKAAGQFYEVDPESLVAREIVSVEDFDADQLSRVEQKLDRVLEWIEEIDAGMAAAALAQGESRKQKQAASQET